MKNKTIKRNNDILISIVTVVYNGADCLERTIKSVISQTYKNIEYIIVDGASTDSTLDIIKKYENNIDYWISEKDHGIYDAMNKAAKVASGDFINFMNADDVILSVNAISDIVSSINNLEDLYFTRASIIGDSTSWIYPSYNVTDYDKWLKLSLPNHQTMFFPKSFYKNNFYDLRLKIGADDDYKLFALQKCHARFIDILFVEFKREGVSSNHRSFPLLVQRVKESYIRNYKHNRYIRFLIDPFKLLLMFVVNSVFGDEKFLRFIKTVLKLKGN